MTDRASYKWAVVARSVRGATHLRNDLPNQDAFAFRVRADGGPPVILAVSDGHGSSKCFRSDIGARSAVEVASNITLEFLEGMGSSPASAIKDAAERLLTGDIIRAWRQGTLQHLQRNPFTADELDRLEREAGVSAREAVQDEAGRLLAYGATLLLVAVGDGFAFYLQLGDGDILAVSDQTRQVESPIFRDPSPIVINEADSLCMDAAQKLFRFRFQYIQGVPPALILSSTDGYSNSFATPGDYYKVGTDLLEMIQRDGLESVATGLPDWLNEATRLGSGDDVTLGIICRKDIIGAGKRERELRPDEARALGAQANAQPPAPEQA